MIVTRETFLANLRNMPDVTADAAERAWLRYAERNGVRVEVPPEDDAALEKSTQHEVVKLFRAMGALGPNGLVYVLSQSRATKQTPGLPDLWVVFAREALAFWWETKRPKGGRHSPAQTEFSMACEVCGIPYGSGSLRDAQDFLIARGIAYRTADGVMERVRRDTVATLDAVRAALGTGLEPHT